MPLRSLGIIPARGGSKGVPRKNIRVLAGRPLIAYTIDAAQTSEQLSHFVVSTEDEEVAAVARSLGADVITRPAELAADDTPMLPVIESALDAIKRRGDGDFDVVIILQPTSPLRIASDIDNAISILVETGADSVVSVYLTVDHHPSKMYRLENGILLPFAPDPPGRLRQNMTPVYHRNGAIYAFRRQLLDEGGVFLGPNLRPLIMPRERSIDIDHEIDFLLAELLISRR